VGLGRSGEVEEAGDHELDLLFFGASVADDGGFDGEGRILGDFEAGGCGGEHGDSADLSEFKGRLDVEGVEDVFDGDLVGLVCGNDGAEVHVNAGKAARQRFARGKLDGAAGQAAELSGGEHFDYAVAGVFSAAVYAEDSHEMQCSADGAAGGTGESFSPQRSQRKTAEDAEKSR
jgi:hypothetical protein